MIILFGGRTETIAFALPPGRYFAIEMFPPALTGAGDDLLELSGILLNCEIVQAYGTSFFPESTST